MGFHGQDRGCEWAKDLALCPHHLACHSNMPCSYLVVIAKTSQSLASCPNALLILIQGRTATPEEALSRSEMYVKLDELENLVSSFVVACVVAENGYIYSGPPRVQIRLKLVIRPLHEHLKPDPTTFTAHPSLHGSVYSMQISRRRSGCASDGWAGPS